RKIPVSFGRMTMLQKSTWICSFMDIRVRVTALYSQWKKGKPGLLRKKTTLRNQNQTAMPGLAAPERED
ncbi:hypothetical protein H8957_017669, partial [Semnopithecus entellus]